MLSGVSERALLVEMLPLVAMRHECADDTGGVLDGIRKRPPRSRREQLRRLLDGNKDGDDEEEEEEYEPAAAETLDPIGKLEKRFEKIVFDHGQKMYRELRQAEVAGIAAVPVIDEENAAVNDAAKGRLKRAKVRMALSKSVDEGMYVYHFRVFYSVDGTPRRILWESKAVGIVAGSDSLDLGSFQNPVAGWRPSQNGKWMFDAADEYDIDLIGAAQAAMNVAQPAIYLITIDHFNTMLSDESYVWRMHDLIYRWRM